MCIYTHAFRFFKSVSHLHKGFFTVVHDGRMRDHGHKVKQKKKEKKNKQKTKQAKKQHHHP